MTGKKIREVLKMTKANSKKALLSSAFALVVIVAILIGTTFAWFTYTASSVSIRFRQVIWTLNYR